MISAIAKAERLYEYAKSQGAKLDTFQLTISDKEAFELLDWFVGQYGDNTLLADDVAIAKLEKNPWGVISNFTLMGFAMVPLPRLH
jgi:hypothetical protein